MAQSISQEAIGATGLPGATAASRHAGATTSGAPTTGTFAVGDYVVDQTGAMYVCTVAGTPGTWQLSGVSVNENIAGKNGFINGSFDFWQRGTNISVGYTYTADRWFAYRSGANSGATVSQQTTGLTGFQYCARMQRNSGDTNSTFFQRIQQTFETKNSILYAGKTVTVSFYIRVGSNFSGTGVTYNLYNGTGTDESGIDGFATGNNVVGSLALNTLTTSWQKFSFTGIIPTNATQIGNYFAYTGTNSATAGANDYFDITGVQLEIAPQATPFSRAGGSIGGELALCQRYYYSETGSAGYNTLLGVGSVYNSSVCVFQLKWPVTMRTNPTMTATSGSGYFLVATASLGFVSFSTVSSFTSPNVVGTIISMSLPGSYTAGQSGLLYSNNGTIMANAEL